jgi:hypothetical protein
LRASIVDAYIAFIRLTLEQHPGLRRHAHLPDGSPCISSWPC